MSEQREMLAKLSKSQKKKRSAQKKKLAKRNAREEEELAAAQLLERNCNEADARIIDQINDEAMNSRQFQMLNIRGKLLVHPSKPFLEAFTTLRQAMGRDTYPNRIHHARRLFLFGVNDFPWDLAMGTATYVSNERSSARPSEGAVQVTSSNDSSSAARISKSVFEDRPVQRRKWLSTGVLGLMVWYPIISTCMAAGDKLACIALRDTCNLLRTCYGIFRNDTTKLEQFVFDARNPSSIKQLEWVARRIEVPPSPPQTPPHGFGYDSSTSHPDNILSRDPFRSPIVVTKRWADYDDDDESLGSPMSLPITPESLGGSDVPALDLNAPNGSTSRGRDVPRRPPTVVVAIPTLTDTAFWFSTNKTVLPVPRLSLFTFEDFPRPHRTSSSRPMKLQSSALKYVPQSYGKVRVRARLENWVREDVERNLKTKLSLGLSSAAKKMVDAQAESVVFNRVTALANNGEIGYIGEPDILGAGVGLSVADVRDVVTGRFRPEKDNVCEGDLRTWSEHWSEDPKTVKIILVPGVEGWLCRHLGELQP